MPQTLLPLFPSICKNLIPIAAITSVYKKAAAVKGIKKITIGSGVRYDMLVSRKDVDPRKTWFGGVHQAANRPPCFGSIESGTRAYL
ncbi:MAG: hypothetical protein IPH88_19720 [Bacteroidales bacterium]|nr:hypothetical protein [Bacteroidales bacterium]